MATASADHAHSGTLVANTVDTITVGNAHPDGIHIINRTGSGTIWYRLDGTNPTVAGPDCHPVLGVRYIDNPFTSGETVVVKLISDQALTYTVEATPKWVRA